eukprot:3939084-Rhodomonas_salina.1
MRSDAKRCACGRGKAAVSTPVPICALQVKHAHHSADRVPIPDLRHPTVTARDSVDDFLRA